LSIDTVVVHVTGFSNIDGVWSENTFQVLARVRARNQFIVAVRSFNTIDAVDFLASVCGVAAKCIGIASWENDTRIGVVSTSAVRQESLAQ